MIGDHKQLPPFDMEKISKLLASTEKVKEAVLLVDDLISRYLRDQGIDDVFREVEDGGDDFGRACADTLSILTLFESLVEGELKRQKIGRAGRPIARRLTQQYRMTPSWMICGTGRELCLAKHDGHKAYLEAAHLRA
jgi:hypothetical protein